MQSVSSTLLAKTDASFRRIFVSVRAAFDKTYLSTVDFFTIGVSTIGGGDIIKGTGSVIQEWDKYQYQDFSNRVMRVEINRETDPPITPYTLATADITLSNHDEIFTASNTSSSLYGDIKSRRPIKISIGIGSESVQKFVGLTDGLPDIDVAGKTATFHCIDFLSAILNIELDTDVIYQDQLTSSIMTSLFEGPAGLSSSQISIQTGSIFIPFAYWPSGTKLGDAIRDLAQAELGRVYLSETGVVCFESRDQWSGQTVAWNFTKQNVLDSQGSSDNTVQNVAEVKSNARILQSKQEIYLDDSLISFSDDTSTIHAGETKYVFVNYDDEDGSLPVTSIDDPVAKASATTSWFEFNTLADGTGTDVSADITLDAVDEFSTGSKFTFTNDGTVSASMIGLRVFGTPAKVVSRIYERVENATSIGTADGYDESPIQIENNLIQDNATARTIGTMLVNDRGDDDQPQDMLVKGIAPLQVGDLVNYTDETSNEDYYVTRLNDIVDSSGYRQRLRLQKRTINSYFRIGISTIGGDDSIGP